MMDLHLLMWPSCLECYPLSECCCYMVLKEAQVVSFSLINFLFYSRVFPCRYLGDKGVLFTFGTGHEDKLFSLYVIKAVNPFTAKISLL